MGRLIFAFPLLAGLSACAQVQIQSSKPLLFDVDIDTEIRSPPLQSGTGAPSGDLQQRRRTRIAELQGLKNARVIGETRNGYLQFVTQPQESAYRSYADRIVQEENRARYLLYSTEAKKQGQSLSQVEARYGERWRDDAFPGEYVQGPDGRWSKKAEPGEQESPKPDD
ncbi:MAG: YdbL family protein [Candidatus Methylacidiphilaceae bacterium]